MGWLVAAAAIGILLPTFVLGDVEFTTPAAGATVRAGTIDVQWKESGISPSIEDLTAYTLVLMTGGNKDDEMLALSTFVSQGDFSSGNSQQGTIPAGIAGPVKNGFFFQILSSTPNGTVINYSDRFSIAGLTGSTPSDYRDAAADLDGSTQGPDSVGEWESPSSSSTTTRAATSTTANTASKVASRVTITATPTSKAVSGTSGSNNQNNSSTFSTGALAGIAIAGVIVGLIGIGLAIWVCLRRRKRKGQDPSNFNDGAGQSQSQEVLHRKEMSVAPPVELDSNARIVEADDGTPPAEMDGNAVRAELQGDTEHAENWGVPLTPVPDTPLTMMTLACPTPMDPGTPVTPRDNV